MLPSRIARRLPRYAGPRTIHPLQPTGQIYRSHVFSPAGKQVRHKFDNPLKSEWFQKNFEDAYTKQPIFLAIALTFVLISFGGVSWVVFFYEPSVTKMISKYPEEVAQPLRKAIYYTNIVFDPKLASKYYNEAYQKVSELKMDPFTEEVIGLQIHISAFYMKADYPEGAIEMLERTAASFERWLKERGNDPEKFAQRNMILGRLVQVTFKLAEYYSLDSVLKPDMAEEKMTYAINMTLKESERREKEGVKEDEGPWLSNEQIGAQFEAMAHFYEARDDHYLAAPLFLRAITFVDPKSCHLTVLMNNLSISLAQQNPHSTPGQPAATTREILISNAVAWSKKAIDIAAHIKPPERTDECDVGCAVATHNLGEFAEMNGEVEEARKRYEEAKSLATAVKFKEGVVNAEKGIKRLTKQV